jgi:signal transduction histidine kinase
LPDIGQRRAAAAAMASGAQDSTRNGKRRADIAPKVNQKTEEAHAPFTVAMFPETSSSTAKPADLSDVVGEMQSELRCLLGPAIQLATDRLPAGGSTPVRAGHEEIVDLLRHLALDAHDAMAAGGTVTIRTGRLREVAECAAMVIHEVPDATAGDRDGVGTRIRKGRGLGLDASYEIIRRAGGHFHVSCRDRETVLTICFPLAE